MNSPLTTLAELEELYGRPADTSLVKEIDYINEDYEKLIRHATFDALATSGPEGLDCSPRGDRRGELVRIVSPRQIMMPDRRGNNRIDSLRNIVRDPRIALMFLIPGHNNALRINGRAQIHADPALLDSFAVEGQRPRSVIVIDIDAIYFQCGRAMIRSALWSPEHFVQSEDLPTAGQILAHLSDARIGGPDYDREWSSRAAKTMW